jgi:hypothetical protein
VGSKAPIWVKKYPALAGYLMKMEQSSTKRTPKRRSYFVPGERRPFVFKIGGGLTRRQGNAIDYDCP